jgi:hypothetical protein
MVISKLKKDMSSLKQMVSCSSKILARNYLLKVKC